MSKETGGAAFPNKQHSDFKIRCECGKYVEFDDVSHSGMSLRDYFAGQVLIGISQNPDKLMVLNYQQISRECYSFADAMLKARGE